MTITVRTKPDEAGRQQFVLNWDGLDHTGKPIRRGQSFFGNVAEAAARMKARVIEAIE